MKRIIICLSAIFLLGCGTSEKNENTQNESTTKANNQKMQQASSLLVNKFMGELKGELMKGVKDGGFENAINVCQINAPEIAKKYSHDYYSIKRVTDQPRNQNNLANEHELEILALFADSLKKLEYFDEWQDPTNKKGYYFYKPIYIGKLCLKCHGESKSIDEKAMLAIQDKYSEDKAIDYNEGELRGMFVVNIKEELGIQLIESHLRDSL